MLQHKRICSKTNYMIQEQAFIVVRARGRDGEGIREKKQKDGGTTDLCEND